MLSKRKRTSTTVLQLSSRSSSIRIMTRSVTVFSISVSSRTFPENSPFPPSILSMMEKTRLGLSSTRILPSKGCISTVPMTVGCTSEFTNSS